MKNSIHIPELFKATLISIFTLISVLGFSTNYITVKDGSLTDKTVWSPSKPKFNASNSNDSIFINHDINLNSNLNNLQAVLVIQPNAKLDGSYTIKLKNSGSIINKGLLEVTNLKFVWGNTKMLNDGTVKVSNDFALFKGVVTNTGNIEVGNDLSIQQSDFINDGIVEVGNDVLLKTKTNFTNTGTLKVDNDLSNEKVLQNSGTIAVGNNFENLYQATFNSTGSLDIDNNLINYNDFTQSGLTTIGNSFTAGFGSDNTFTANLGVTNLLDIYGEFNVSATTIVSGDFFLDWGIDFENSGNLEIDGASISEGNLTNTGTILIEDDFSNFGHIVNSNTIQVDGNASSDYGSTVANSGTYYVLSSFTNDGSFVNDGSFLVDGAMNSGGGTVTGTGTLCNSDGTTDPTSGSKGSVACNICGGDGTNLPIELISFQAQYNNQVIDLTWTTATELNNDYFVVEVSTDGVNFDFVGHLKGAGTSNEMNTYSMTDAHAKSGVSYYRLMQVDYDGATTYFNMVMVQKEEAQELNVNVYPNPVRSGSNLNIQSSSNVSIEIYNSNGQRVQMHKSESVIVTLSTSGLAKGFYFIKIYDGNTVASRKVHIL